MAKNYIDNLSEETRKGMTEKAEQGLWPSNATLGYRNVTGSDGKKTVVPDPSVAPIIRNVYDWYARGDISIREATKKARSAGLVFRKSAGRVPSSTVAKILRNRIYTGWFDWDGKTYRGCHEPIISVDLWGQVQDVLDGRIGRRARTRKRDFAFSGLIVCGACGCAIVGEIKKERHVCYHCTGYADKCRGSPAACRRKHMREEALEEQFTAMLARLHFDDEVLECASSQSKNRAKSGAFSVSCYRTAHGMMGF